MKLFTVALCLFGLILTIPAFSQGNQQIQGAWSTEKDGKTHLLLVTNQHYSYTIYDLPGKKFIHTEGGSWEHAGQMNLLTEFNTTDKSAVGKKHQHKMSVSNGNLETEWPGLPTSWKRVDEGGGALNATWRINGREQNGQMHEIARSARKTIKILTGTRFQWAAINTETGEFFGTGGGTYSFKDGRYTEQIEFFSRDSSRVGMQLSFEGEVKGDVWHHKGKSSKGDPIYETWKKED